MRGCTPGYTAFLPLCSYSEYILFICLSPSAFLWASRSNQENIPKLCETDVSRRIGFIGNGAIVRQSRGWEQQEATRAGGPKGRVHVFKTTLVNWTMGFCPEDAGAAETLELLERKTEEGGEVPCPPPSHPPSSRHCIHCISLVQQPWNCRTELSFQQARGGRSQGLDRWLWAHLGPTYSLYFQLYTDLNSPDVEKFESIVSYKQCYKTLL